MEVGSLLPRTGLLSSNPPCQGLDLQIKVSDLRFLVHRALNRNTILPVQSCTMETYSGEQSEGEYNARQCII